MYKLEQWVEETQLLALLNHPGQILDRDKQDMMNWMQIWPFSTLNMRRLGSVILLRELILSLVMSVNMVCLASSFLSFQKRAEDANTKRRRFGGRNPTIGCNCLEIWGN